MTEQLILLSKERDTTKRVEYLWVVRILPGNVYKALYTTTIQFDDRNEALKYCEDRKKVNPALVRVFIEMEVE